MKSEDIRYAYTNEDSFCDGFENDCTCYKNGTCCATSCAYINCKNFLHSLIVFRKRRFSSKPYFRQWLDRYAADGKPLDLRSPAVQEHILQHALRRERGRSECGA